MKHPSTFRRDILIKRFLSKIEKLLILAALLILSLCCLSACDGESPVFYLDTPNNLRIELGVLKWDKVEKADEYILTINGKQETVKGTYYDKLEEGLTYDISVKAKNVWTYSEESESLHGTVLSSPTNFVWFKDRFYYDDVEGATCYVITVDGVDYEVVAGAKAYFEFYEAGTKQAMIRAVGDNKNYFDSSYSEEMPVRVDDIPWESIESQLPKGKGTKESPYTIETQENLKWFTELVKENYLDAKDVYFELGSSIDMRFISGFEPIGSSDKPFLGKFDGNGKSIYYLHVTANKAGIFGCVGEGAEVLGLSSYGGKIKGYTTAGGIAASNLGLIMNCTNGSLIEGNTAGGIVAENTDSKLVLSCVNYGDVSGENVGGIAGWNWNGTINQCKNYGKVVAMSNGGGVVGTNAGNVFYCENQGSVDAKNAGGIAYSNLGSMKSVANGGYISGEKAVGGVAATNNGTIKYAYNTGFVYCNSDYSDRYAGGIVGNMADGKLILCYNVNSYSTASARSTGRLVGYYRSGLLTDCYYVKDDNDDTLPVGNTENYIGSTAKMTEEEFFATETLDYFNSLVDKEDLTIFTSEMFIKGEKYPIFYWQ